MKKIIAIMLIALSTSLVSARETIQIIYGFSAADNSTNYSRNLAEEANKIQDKYTFIFDVKPGAGNAIAGSYVKNTPNSIFMTSGVFWVRPAFYPKESYNPNDFRTLVTQCSVPFSVASSKYSTWKEVPKDQPISIATSGLGVISHLMAIEIVRLYPNATIVPYKSTVDALVATLGGQVDLAVTFIGDAEKYNVAEEGKSKLNILGITGTKSISKYVPLVDQGFPVSLGKMNTPFNLMIPKTFPEDKAKEIREIFLKVENKKSVRDSYAIDHCQPFQVAEKDLARWWDEQSKYWTNLTVGVKVSQ